MIPTGLDLRFQIPTGSRQGGGGEEGEEKEGGEKGGGRDGEREGKESL